MIFEKEATIIRDSRDYSIIRDEDGNFVLKTPKKDFKICTWYYTPEFHSLSEAKSHLPIWLLEMNIPCSDDPEKWIFHFQIAMAYEKLGFLE